MRTRKIIDLQLESFFGHRFPPKIQRLVNEELNQGRWMDGYELAACLGGKEIEGDAARELLKIILNHYPSLRIDESTLRRTAEARLAQSLVGSVSWIVDDSGAFALTDGLVVARFESSSMIWKSRRIAYDGISFDSLSEGKLRGRAWVPGFPEDTESPFVFDFETGELLKGQIVQHE
jgi:hypothetical protein